MYYTENEARRLVIEAGHRLLENGLIARTWGNISARISETEFIITPSGRAYDTLRPEELVKVRIADCSYEGDIKPSSEKGIHADGYAQRSDAAFIIHTHQFYASVIAASGCTTGTVCVKSEPVPIAGYGMPSTGKLRKNVAAAVAAFPESRVVLLAGHGTMCMGRDIEEAFELADELENECRRTAEAVISCGLDDMPGTGAPQQYIDEMCGGLERLLPGTKVRFTADPAVRAVSQTGRTARPLLDDMAQIAGTSVRCACPNGSALKTAERLVTALKGRNAAFIKGFGAVCTGSCDDDAEAVEMILKKNCAAALYSGKTSGIGRIDAFIQRLVYVKKYSKRKNEPRGRG